MAAKYDVPFLGKIPLDPAMLGCCEEGRSFTDTHPSSPTALAFLSVVSGMYGLPTSRCGVLPWLCISLMDGSFLSEHSPCSFASSLGKGLFCECSRCDGDCDGDILHAALKVQVASRHHAEE